MDAATQRVMYATKLKAHYFNATGCHLSKRLAMLDGDTARFLTGMVSDSYRKGTEAAEVADIIKFYTHDMVSAA